MRLIRRMIEFVSGLTPFYFYPALFFGLIFLGGIVLLPAMYLSLDGTVHLLYLFIATVLAGVLSDSFWYYVGRHAKEEKLYKLKIVKKRIEEAKRFSAFFSRHGALLVFLTKFVYGTRIASHVLAGMHKIKYMQFTAATAMGTAIWFLVFYFLIRSIDVGITAVKATALRIQLLFLVLFVVVIFLNWFTGKVIRKKMMRS